MTEKDKKIKHTVLNGKQKRHLRGLGHHLSSKVILGKEGITENLILSLENVLEADELVKVKVGNGCVLDRKDAAEELSRKTGAAVAQILGKTILLFRENKDCDNRIALPSL